MLITGEQVKILACLSAYREDIEIITPFKVAALMNKNGVDQNSKSQNGSTDNATNPVSDGAKLNDGEYMNQNGTVKQGKYDLKKEASAGESLLRREDHRRQTESLLLRMKTSHFFARIAEPDEVLWTRRKATEDSSKMIGENVAADDLETQKTTKKKLSLSAAIDRGNFDAITSGGVARNAMKSCALPNGDIVVCIITGLFKSLHLFLPSSVKLPVWMCIPIYVQQKTIVCNFVRQEELLVFLRITSFQCKSRGINDAYSLYGFVGNPCRHLKQIQF